MSHLQIPIIIVFSWLAISVEKCRKPTPEALQKLHDHDISQGPQEFKEENYASSIAMEEKYSELEAVSGAL